MSKYKMLDGNAAAVEAVSLARVNVISAYPITPQSSIAEKLSEAVDSGRLKARYIRVESEHTAMSAAVGAQLTGVRAFTATSSVGLALMTEVLGVASGCRTPIVMPVVNRSLASPWSLWCDHQDSMTVRDTGWLQFYCENVQDVLDIILCSYRIAEDSRVQLPIMVCLDGFFLSHSMQKLSVPDPEAVDAFIGTYTPKNVYLNPEDPVIIDNLTPTDEQAEMHYQHVKGMENGLPVADEVFAEFEKRFGRSHGCVEGHRLDDAETVLVTLGSMSGTAQYVVDRMREEGRKVGLLKIVSYRPFPTERVRQALAGARRIAVIDRSVAPGAPGGPLWADVVAAVKDSGKPIKDYIAGLGGRDIGTATIRNVFDNIQNISCVDPCAPTWIDLKDNPMELRKVTMYA